MKATILKLIALCLTITAGFITFTGRSYAGGAGQGTAAATPVASQEKTVDQTRKNIQVLKGMPESELGTVMNYVATSLGVRCNYCHVNKGGNNWVWEADDKEEKLTARAMMKMVLAINKDNFRGNIEVGCNTCHRGRTTPQSVPTFPLPTPAARPQAPPPAAGGSASPTPTPAPTPAPPTADQILAKYIDAVGGQAAIDKIKTRVMKGTYIGVNGAEVPFEATLSAPDKFHINVTTQQGAIERGFDGKTGWEKSARGINDLENPLLDNLKSIFGSFHNIKLREQYTRVRAGRRDRIGERDVITVTGTGANNRREQLFFDLETGLLLRRIIYMPSMLGVIPEQMDFEDYRDVDGVKLPFTIKVSSVEPGLVSTRRFAEIKLNVPVPDSKFAMPAGAKPANP